MFTRIQTALGFALLFSLLFVIPVFAGGWAVITLDELPTNVVANEPVTIGFTVLQHGRTPLDGLYPTITANLYKDQELVAQAEPGDQPGYYTATLIFPKEGEWRWSIQAFTMDQPMPMLSVAPAGSIVSNPTVAKIESAAPPWMLVGGLSLGVGVVGAVIAFRRRSRPVAVLTAVSLLAGIALFIMGAAPPSGVEAQAKSKSEAANSSSISQVEFGRQLFIAKGCITCHHNSKAGSTSDYWTIEMGAPNLSKFSANPEVLFMRLKDPSSVKSDTQMPNLDLTKVEIEALVAFINSK
jgi:hypothetical protein